MRHEVVGRGAAGLSAALFTPNGLETTLSDTDETWLHEAHLFNYLGPARAIGAARPVGHRDNKRALAPRPDGSGAHGGKGTLPGSIYLITKRNVRKLAAGMPRRPR
jgi:hypothetical protein